MIKLRWVGKIAAVLSALVLASAYVASRAAPGFLQSFQVFGGEGGGQAIPRSSSDDSHAAVLGSSKFGGGVLKPEDVQSSARTGATKHTSNGPAIFSPDRIMPSSKSAALADGAYLVVGHSSNRQEARPSPPHLSNTQPAIMSSSKSGAIFGATTVTGGVPMPTLPLPSVPPQAIEPIRPIQPSHRVVLSDGTVIELGNASPGYPAQTAPKKKYRPRPAANANYANGPQQGAPPADAPRDQQQPLLPPDLLGGSKSAPIFRGNGQR